MFEKQDSSLHLTKCMANAHMGHVTVDQASIVLNSTSRRTCCSTRANVLFMIFKCHTPPYNEHIAFSSQNVIYEVSVTSVVASVRFFVYALNC